MENFELGHHVSLNPTLSFLSDLLLHHWASHCRVLGLLSPRAVRYGRTVSCRQGPLSFFRQQRV